MTVSPLRNSYVGVGFGVVAIVFWSCTALFCCFLKKVPIFQILAVCYLIGGITNLTVNRQMFSFKILFNNLRKNWMKVFLLAVNGMGYISAFRFAPAAHVDLILYMWPLMVVVGDSWISRKKLSVLQYSGALLGFLGVVMIVLPELIKAKIHLSYVVGYLIAFIASLSWAIYTLWNRKGEKRNRKELAYDFVVVGSLFVLVQWFQEGWFFGQTHEMIILVLLAVCVYGLAFNFWMRGLEQANPVILGGLSHAIPILSISWLIIAGFADFSPSVFIASLLVTTGCMLIGKHELNVSKEDCRVIQEITLSTKEISRPKLTKTSLCTASLLLFLIGCSGTTDI